MEEGTAWFQQHPLITAGVSRSLLIPYRLYGDGAESQSHLSETVVSANLRKAEVRSAHDATPFVPIKRDITHTDHATSMHAWHRVGPRLTVINASYVTPAGRTKILELIAWSCNALSHLSCRSAHILCCEALACIRMKIRGGDPSRRPTRSTGMPRQALLLADLLDIGLFWRE